MAAWGAAKFDLFGRAQFVPQFIEDFEVIESRVTAFLESGNRTKIDPGKRLTDSDRLTESRM